MNDEILYKCKHSEDFLSKWADKNLFDIKNKYDNTIFHLFRYDENFIRAQLEKNPQVNIFELKNIYGFTIFHTYKYTEEFLYEQMQKYPGFDYTILHAWKYDEEFLKRTFPDVKFIELTDMNGNTIFHNHKYSDDFLMEELSKSPTVNIFELKNECDHTVFYCHEYIETIKKFPEVNPFEIFDQYNRTIFHMYNYEEYLKDVLCRYPKINPFKYTERIYRESIFHGRGYSEDFIIWCVKRDNYRVDILELQDWYWNNIFHFQKYSEDFVRWCVDVNPVNIFCSFSQIKNSSEYSKEIVEYCRNPKYCACCLCRNCENKKK